jgi:hypothetical protein
MLTPIHQDTRRILRLLIVCKGVLQGPRRDVQRSADKMTF